jgi:hypothetical protein
VVIAGVGITSYWILVQQSSGQAVGIHLGNGLTFDQAFTPVNATITNLNAGPWQPISVLGIATEAPVAPAPYYSTSLNLTMRLCGELPGVTVWNSTGIPVFAGSLNSGAAPFWSFLFKNSTGSLAYATNLGGAVRIDGPSPTLANCVQAAGINLNFTVNPSVDTPAIAQTAFSAAGRTFSAEYSPIVQYYVLGSTQIGFVAASPFGWIVNYFRCDLVGVSGYQNYSAVGDLASGNDSATFVNNGWVTCTLPSYHIVFVTPPPNTTNSSVGTTDVSLPFLVSTPRVLANNTTLYDSSDLLTWMTRLQLATGSDGLLPSSPDTRQAWVPSLSDCQSNGSGWSTLLQSQTGAWLDSYPSTTNDSAWAIPNVIVSSQDRFILVCPELWDLSADSLNVLGSPLAPAVTGSVTL